MVFLVAWQRTYIRRSTRQSACHQSPLCQYWCLCLWVDWEVGRWSPATVLGLPARRCRPSCRPTATGVRAAPVAVGHWRALRRPSSNDAGCRQLRLPDNRSRLLSLRSTKPPRHPRSGQTPVSTCWSTRRTVRRRRPLPRCCWFQISRW